MRRTYSQWAEDFMYRAEDVFMLAMPLIMMVLLACLFVMLIVMTVDMTTKCLR